MQIPDVRELLNAQFQEVTEGEHHGHPDLRMHGRIFGSLWPSKNCVILRLPDGTWDALSESIAGSRLVSRQGGMNWIEFPLDSLTTDQLHPWIELAISARA